MRTVNACLFVLIVLGTFLPVSVNCQEEPTYCLLFQPQYPNDPCPCYQFYLASIISDAPRAFISGGECQVTDIGGREGWMVANIYPLTWEVGDQYMSWLSPYFEDALGCNDCRSGSYTPSDDGPVSNTYERDDYGPNYDDLNRQ
jgi:hypothetical protein